MHDIATCARHGHADLRRTLSLTLALLLIPLSTPAVAANAPPKIWGKPPAWVGVDKPYSFRPGASDADRDRLRYSIVNKPQWMWFDTNTGRLVGTATDAQAGRTFADIRIRVSDGVATAALAPFSIRVGAGATRDVTLTWAAPTRNTDGSRLNNLAGYRLFYGQASRRYSKSLNVPQPSTRSATIENLPHGTWYFAIKSINNRGVASPYSAEIRATI
jgi:hypothetical protein